MRWEQASRVRNSIANASGSQKDDDQIVVNASRRGQAAKSVLNRCAGAGTFPLHFLSVPALSRVPGWIFWG